MNLPSLLLLIGIMTAQIIAFLAGWNVMVGIARDLGRFRPELFFGATTTYGTIGIISLFVICGLVTGITRKRQFCRGAILTGLIAWLVWLLPSFPSRPISMPAFFIWGAILLIVGDGIILPRFFIGRSKPL